MGKFMENYEHKQEQNYEKEVKLLGIDRMKTAMIKSMNVMCSSMGMPQTEPILKEYLIK